eukprot:6178949-Pleurochrysis_carterae.AAC.3
MIVRRAICCVPLRERTLPETTLYLSTPSVIPRPRGTGRTPEAARAKRLSINYVCDSAASGSEVEISVQTAINRTAAIRYVTSAVVTGSEDGQQQSSMLNSVVAVSRKKRQAESSLSFSNTTSPTRRQRRRAPLALASTSCPFHSPCALCLRLACLLWGELFQPYFRLGACRLTSPLFNGLSP